MIIPIGFGLATFVFSGEGAPLGAVSTLGFSEDHGWSPNDCAEVFAEAFEDRIMVRLCATITLASVKVKYGPNDIGPEGTNVSGVAGSVADEGTPPSTAVLVNKVTALGGREGRGRMFIPGLDQDLIESSGSLKSAEAAEWVTALDNFRDDLIAQDVPPFLLHNSATVPTAITALVPAPKIGVLKRRLRH